MIKNSLLVLNGILLIAVGVLFYLHFSDKKTVTVGNSIVAQKNSLPADNSFRIAYFEIDSVSENFFMVKDVRAELDKKQDSINTEIERLDKSYHDKYNEYQGKAASMSQVQSETAANELMKIQDDIKNEKKDLDQKYNDLVTRRMNDVKEKIEAFLKEYNKDKKYSYIISYEPGLFYYKDTAYNITTDVVNGLNEMYKQKKR
ncbi:MAG: OmpH family outer membrane protein [Chitinophagales bacterium]